MTIKIFYDCETTGFSPTKNSIHQLAGSIEVDDLVVENFDIKMAPHPKAVIEPRALEVCGVTEEQIRAYPDAREGHANLKEILARYVDSYDKTNKAHLVGYNNRHFDDQFLRKHFEIQNDNFFGAWFYGDTIDVLPLASEYLIDRRPNMPSFKLHRVAQELGIEVDANRTHEAGYDVELTYLIYRIVTGRDLEL